MVNFIKYPSLTNHDANKSLEFLRQAGLLSTRGHITEKFHGCFRGNSMVRMYDNTLKEIKNINIGDVVLGCDENLSIVPSIVTNSACTGLSKKWYHIKVKTGQKGTAQILKCTGNHQIFTKEFGWIEAENLQGNENCFYSKQCYDLTQIQKSILIGKLLGDGTICKQHGNLSISYGHKKEHEEYINYCINILGDLSKGSKKFGTSGFGSKMVITRLKHLLSVNEEFKCWINNNKKTIPSNLILDKYSLAFWYMDDGSLSHNKKQKDRASFATCNFSDTECNILINALKTFGFKNPIFFKDTSGYPRIRLNLDDANLLFDEIKELIPPIMQYKLPLEFQNYFIEPIVKSNNFKYYSYFTPIDSISIINEKINSKGNKKYDIETTTQNFFVGSLLVHNSNFSFIWNNETKTLQVASRNGILSNDGEGFYQAKNVVASLKQNVIELAKYLNCDFQLFGELFGGSIQSEIKYGCEQSFIAFDLLIDNDYVYQEQLENFCEQFEIPVAKSHGIFTFDELLAMNVEIESPFAKANGISSIIEGFVWKPTETQWYQKTPEEKIRVVVKYKSKAFSEKKAARETKAKKVLTSTLGDFENVIDMYINNTRIDAVVSKIGEVSIKDFGKILPLFTADVLEDLEKDEEVLDMVETKKYINQKCIALLRPYLQKMS